MRRDRQADSCQADQQPRIHKELKHLAIGGVPFLDGVTGESQSRSPGGGWLLRTVPDVIRVLRGFAFRYLFLRSEVTFRFIHGCASGH